MRKFFLVLFFSLFFFLFVSSGFYLIYSQSISVNQEKVVYNLPYPGILPDHPLYGLKLFRDKIMEIVTRDTIRKTETYLLFSDKRAAMVRFLVEKGKDKLAISTLEEGEEYFSKIPKLLETSKKQGVSPIGELVQRLKLSNIKHREVAETLLKELPQGQNDEINDILRVNQEIKKALQKY